MFQGHPRPQIWSDYWPENDWAEKYIKSSQGYLTNIHLNIQQGVSADLNLARTTVSTCWISCQSVIKCYFAALFNQDGPGLCLLQKKLKPPLCMRWYAFIYYKRHLMIHHPQPLRRITDDLGTSHRLMRPQVQGDPNMRSSASGRSGFGYGRTLVIGKLLEGSIWS